MKIVVWIHGVELTGDGFGAIEDCISAVNELLPKGQFIHHFFNWSSFVEPRETIVERITSKDGNLICRKITRLISRIGCDMWWTLQTKRLCEPGDIEFSIQDKLKTEIDLLLKEYPGSEICFVCHSWGNYEGLQYVINHSSVPIRMVSLGNPLFYGAGAFEDWGNPDLLDNIVSPWVNIYNVNDPIGRPMSENPGPNAAKWRGFVRDIPIKSWHLFPLLAHTMYWSSGEVQKEIAKALSA